MVTYLKKARMTQILNEVFGISAKVKNTRYSFYRGTEWLKYYTGNYTYDLCAQNGGDYLTVHQTYHNEDGVAKTLRYEVLNGYGNYKCEIA